MRCVLVPGLVRVLVTWLVSAWADESSTLQFLDPTNFFSHGLFPFHHGGREVFSVYDPLVNIFAEPGSIAGDGPLGVGFPLSSGG
jgi:hypothetical protein